MTSPAATLDKIVGLSRQLVAQAGAVALETNDQIDSGSFDYGTWAKSMLDLFDFGISAGLELAPDMFAPCVPCLHLPSDEPEYSEYVSAPERPVARRASVVPGSFIHDGAPSFVIPDYLIHVDPPVLKPYATEFRISVLWPGLRSGTYRGYVRFVPDVVSNIVVEDIVRVIIDL